MKNLEISTVVDFYIYSIAMRVMKNLEISTVVDIGSTASSIMS